MDAFEKLQQLGLRGQQQRETVHVLMACCLQEKIYNPYYAVLAQKLCDFDRKYQVRRYSLGFRVVKVTIGYIICLRRLSATGPLLKENRWTTEIFTKCALL